MNNQLKYQEYTATVSFSDSDEVFYGRLLGIDDLVIFEGHTVVELKKNMATAVEDYIATCMAVGKTPNKAYKGSFNVRVSPTLHKQANVLATSMKMTLNEFVKTALDYAIHHPNEIAK